MDKEPKDPRSTNRKRARRVLESRPDIPYWCNKCGRSPTAEDAPGGLWPGIGVLQANHRNKVLSDLDPANLEWLCASCHKEEDQQTAKGVSRFGDEWGYGAWMTGEPSGTTDRSTRSDDASSSDTSGDDLTAHILDYYDYEHKRRTANLFLHNEHDGPVDHHDFLGEEEHDRICGCTGRPE